MVITGWFVLLVGAGALPIIAIAEPWVLPLWLVVCVLLAAVDVALAPSPRRLGVARSVPARARLGDTVHATVTVSNPHRRTARLAIRDAWRPSAGATPPRQRLTVPAGERRSISTDLTPFRRGAISAAEVTIRSSGPLMLAARQVSYAAPATLTVLPRFSARRHLPSRLARLRELDGSASVQVRGQGTEFDSLREYVRGDDVRSIDWRASARRTGALGRDARHGGSTIVQPELVVRTWRPERDRRVVIVIDSGRSAAARIGDETRIDTAFETSLLLGALASSAGDRVDLAIYDRRMRGRVRAANGAELLTKMVEVMATIEPELIEPDWSAVPGIVRTSTSQRALVVLCTTSESPEAARALLAVLPELTRKHLVLVASVDDPSVIEATTRRARSSDLAVAAAAERAMVERGRLAASVRALGADIVTATPAELPPVVADRYLGYKAAGRL